MDKQLVNITLQLVEEDIEPILAQQPARVQSCFQQLNLHAELAAYVLSRIPNHHIVVSKPGLEYLNHHLTQESAERQLCRERFIQEGIYWVLEKHPPGQSDRTSQIAEASPRRAVALGHSGSLS